MITTTQLTNQFEDDLNAIMHTTTPEIQFKIWSNVGKHEKPVRSGNTAPYFIEGQLSTTASTIEANTLVMGVNALQLDFVIPLEVPRTQADQTAAELEKIQDGQFYMPAYIMGVLSEYFQSPRVLYLSDKQNVLFTVGIVGGVAIPNNVQRMANYGDVLKVSVYINANIVENGIVSSAIVLYIDNNITLPAQSKVLSRAVAVNSDVLSNNLATANVATSSAFVLQVTLPATNGNETNVIRDLLLKGTLNEAHFIVIDYGGAIENKFMIISKADSNAQGVSIASLSIELVDAFSDIEMLAVPDSYQVGEFTISDNSERTELTFTSGTSTRAYIGGEVIVLKVGENTVPITPDDYVDNGDGTYSIYIITLTETTITTPDYNSAEVNYQTIKAVKGADV